MATPRVPVPVLLVVAAFSRHVALLEQARAALVGETFGPELAEHVGNLAAQEIKPISDVRATSAYRRSVAFVIVRDALMQAWDNCG